MLFSPSTTLTSSSSLTSLSSSSSLTPSSSPSLLFFHNRLSHQPLYYSYYHGYCSSSKKVATASIDFLVLVTTILFQTKRAPQVLIKKILRSLLLPYRSIAEDTFPDSSRIVLSAVRCYGCRVWFWRL